MEADRHGIEGVVPPRYTQVGWGDLIEGTKGQLQAFGLGVGLAFPGERGAPDGDLHTTDARGFRVTISTSNGGGRFSAFVSFPELPPHPSEKPTWYASGVTSWATVNSDVFVGTAAALADAGLVRPEQLPGQPGMRKTRVTVFPDGTTPTGAPTANHRAAYLPGAQHIKRASKISYRVSVVVSEEEKNRRRTERDQWRQRHRPQRPARLQPVLQECEGSRWSSATAGQRRPQTLAEFRAALDRIQSADFLGAPQMPTEGVRRHRSMSELREMWNNSSGNEELPELGTAARKACDAEVDELLTRLRRGDASSGRRAAS